MAECLFCDIVSGEIKGQIVYRDDLVAAFKDVNPKAPVHLLIVPNKHIATLLEVADEDLGLMGHILGVSRKLASDSGLGDKGFRLVVNCGPQAGQSVYHLHFHLLGGRPLSWPPG